jgi:hypothetical protein
MNGTDAWNVASQNAAVNAMMSLAIIPVDYAVMMEKTT